MSVFKSILGITLLITSMSGEATGRVGKQTADYVSKVSHQASEKVSSYWQNDFAKYATNALVATECLAKNGQKLFENLEKKSKKLGGYANNLLRDEEYRSLKAKDDFDPKFTRGDRGAGGGGDWTLISPSWPEIKTEIKNDIQESLNTDIRGEFKPLPTLPQETSKLVGKKIETKCQKAVKPKKTQDKPIKSSFFNTLFKKSFFR